MNTQILGIPSIARSAGDHLIPVTPAVLPPLIQRMASSHAAVLEKWNCNFALDLRRPPLLLPRRTVV